EGRIVREHGADTGEHGATAGAKTLDVLSRLGTGDPLAFAAGHGGAAIEAHADLAADVGQAGTHAFEKARVERGGLRIEQGAVDSDAGAAKAGEAFATDQGVGVFHGVDDARYAGGDEGFGAGAGAAVVGAGFEGDVGG